MHNGIFGSLPEVIHFYQRIGRGVGRRADGPGLNPHVTREQIDPLALQLNMRGGGQADLIAFLRALDDPGFDKSIPQRVPSGLPAGGRLQP